MLVVNRLDVAFLERASSLISVGILTLYLVVNNGLNCLDRSLSRSLMRAVLRLRLLLLG